MLLHTLEHAAADTTVTALTPLTEERDIDRLEHWSLSAKRGGIRDTTIILPPPEV